MASTCRAGPRARSSTASPSARQHDHSAHRPQSPSVTSTSGLEELEGQLWTR
jgi:hypothetical protein